MSHEKPANSKGPHRRLREQTVRDIRAARAKNPPATYAEIAYKFDVSIGTVYNICKGKTWSWLT